MASTQVAGRRRTRSRISSWCWISRWLWVRPTAVRWAPGPGRGRSGRAGARRRRGCASAVPPCRPGRPGPGRAGKPRRRARSRHRAGRDGACAPGAPPRPPRDRLRYRPAAPPGRPGAQVAPAQLGQRRPVETDPTSSGRRSPASSRSRLDLPSHWGRAVRAPRRRHREGYPARIGCPPALQATSRAARLIGPPVRDRG